MSGCCTGIKQRIKLVAPMAVYVQILYVFMSTSKAHTVYMQQQPILHPEKPTHQLQHLSDTRWACRFYAVDAVYSK